ncbi:MAG: hypothetical protein ONA90_11580, partial [candidate division KSB1 bacterium]|nr:hypothetical protein [candidate division KSB1 bacterium]
MKKIFAVVALICWCAFLVGMNDAGVEYDKYWPQWRGPRATGVAPYGNPPAEWSEQKNIRWKIEIPGKGLASPIVWGDQIFILTAIETDKLLQPQSRKGTHLQEAGNRRGRRGGIQPSNVLQFSVLAIHRRDGKIIWQRTAREQAPHEGTHETGSWASPSGVTDGRYVFAYFGSRGLYCYDLQGKLR